jgi:hypothetical protein
MERSLGISISKKQKSKWVFIQNLELRRKDSLKAPTKSFFLDL